MGDKDEAERQEDIIDTMMAWAIVTANKRKVKVSEVLDEWVEILKRKEAQEDADRS